MTPQRIQLRRTKGWRKPEGAIVVSRPSRWGNPYRVVRGDDLVGDVGADGDWHVVDEQGRIAGAWHSKAEATAYAVDCYRYRATEAPGYYNFVLAYIDALRGHDLACWCPLEDGGGVRVPCHADVLLELANP